MRQKFITCLKYSGISGPTLALVWDVTTYTTCLLTANRQTRESIFAIAIGWKRIQATSSKYVNKGSSILYCDTDTVVSQQFSRLHPSADV